MVKVIGGAQEGEFKAVASGTLPNGNAVVVNADGTVSSVVESPVAQQLGSDAQFEAGTVLHVSSTYDANAQKVVIAYMDEGNSDRGTAVVGTVSGTSISFGTPVVFETGATSYINATYDANAQKIVIAYKDGGNSNYGTAVVGTVSGTSISFGTPVVFESAITSHIFSAYDASAQKVVIAYRDEGNTDRGTAVVATVSGTSISYGSPVIFETSRSSDIAVVYDSENQKVVVAYLDRSDFHGKAVVGTVSGTSISFGSIAEFETSSQAYDLKTTATYDSNSKKVVIAYRASSNSFQVTAVVGTVSDTSILFGAKTTFGTVNADLDRQISAVYAANSGKVVITYHNASDSFHSYFAVGTVSGTSISFGTPVEYESAEGHENSVVYDANSEKVVVAYRNSNNSNRGSAVVFSPAYTGTNLTSENYIGMSRGVAIIDEGSEAVGSETVFESATTSIISSVYDSNANKTVIVYKDQGNSSHGTAIVATVSGTSISYGSPVVFYAATANHIDAAFDSNSNKIVVVYSDSGTNNGTAIVGTVSGTSISFGSPVVFNSGNTQYCSVVFDSSNNKIVVSYVDAANSSHGTAIVGTVSGTAISFGSEVVFESAGTAYLSSTFDTNSNKVVIGYQDTGNSSHGTAIVGTVSGTSISFGSATVFESATVTFVQTGFDSTNNKVVIAYRDDGNSYYGTAIVGTVSGTGISFGTAAVFQSSQANVFGVAHDSNAQKNVIFFRDQTSSAKGTVIVGTVSGTSISFNTKTVVNDGSSEGHTHNAVYDSTAQKVVITYKDDGNSSYGTAVVYQTAYDKTIRGEVASGGNATVDIIGSLSTNQGGLTAGQQYFVQTDGTIGLTAANPSVLAGTAISASKLLVKT